MLYRPVIRSLVFTSLLVLLPGQTTVAQEVSEQERIVLDRRMPNALEAVLAAESP